MLDTVASPEWIGWLLHYDGQYNAQASLMHAVRQACEKSGHRKSVISLHSHHLWTVALYNQGKYMEAENVHRAVVSIRERVLAPEHLDTLGTCFNLSLPLKKQGRKAEALGYARRALAGMIKVLGKEKLDTQAAKRRVEKL